MHNLIKKTLEKKVKMKFKSYYKFTFSFNGCVELDGETYEVSASLGGNPDDIYRLEISADTDKILDEDFSFIEIKKDGISVAYWDNF